MNSNFNGMSLIPANTNPATTAAKMRKKKPSTPKKTILQSKINTFIHPDRSAEATSEDSERLPFERSSALFSALFSALLSALFLALATLSLTVSRMDLMYSSSPIISSFCLTVFA